MSLIMNNKKPKRGMSYLLSIDDSLGTNAVRVPRAHVAPEAVNFYITQDTQKHILAPVLRSGEFQQHGVYPHNSHKSGTRGLAVPTFVLFEDI